MGGSEGVIYGTDLRFNERQNSILLETEECCFLMCTCEIPDNMNLKHKGERNEKIIFFYDGHCTGVIGDS